jgi:glycosyltransferase involved in cell wall biosynthesis
MKTEFSIADGISSLLVFHWGDSSTTDHYFRYQKVQGLPVSACIDISRTTHLPEINNDVLVVIVRYLSTPLIKWLKTHRAKGGSVAYFMDDDLPRDLYDNSLPWRYRLLLWRQFGRYLHQIENLCDALWVSTPSLAERYAYALPLEISPRSLVSPPQREKTTYFYHGNPSSHRSDIEWLREVVQLTQTNSDDLLFMIIGGKQVRRLFANLPRTLILHPLSWPTYRDALPSLPHHIGLAPLLPTAFNATRSTTRFYDFTHLGAVGLYSDTPPYQAFIRHGVDGYLLPNDPQVWSQHIIQLAEKPQTRSNMLQAARQRAENNL